MKLKQKIIEQLNISGKLSQSFYGEDILLWRYFKLRNIKNGFFIDVGAYHPKFFNNTWRLRKKLGFRGINIEPMGVKLFNRFRKDDINIATLIGNTEGEAILKVVSGEPSLSGLDSMKMVREFDNTIKISQTTLREICKKYNVKKIDLLDIDVEGTEMDILRGHNWEIKPRIILIEDDKDKKGEIKEYLTFLGYRQIAHTLNNAIYENT